MFKELFAGIEIPEFCGPVDTVADQHLVVRTQQEGGNLRVMAFKCFGHPGASDIPHTNGAVGAG